MHPNLKKEVIHFAKSQHASQVRKYTHEPYYVHLEEVAELVTSVPHTDEMYIAAWLHDTLEDTDTTEDEIRNRFGEIVLQHVIDLTDVSQLSDGNRKVRKEIDRRHIKAISAESKTIKLADLISNTKSIVQYDQDFARVYLEEKRLLLDVLQNGDPSLYQLAKEQVWKGKEKLRETQHKTKIR